MHLQLQPGTIVMYSSLLCMIAKKSFSTKQKGGEEYWAYQLAPTKKSPSFKNTIQDSEWIKELDLVLIEAFGTEEFEVVPNEFLHFPIEVLDGEEIQGMVYPEILERISV
ncbi:MAG: hypothetical protein IPN70_00525 [Candidatus Moraniibacteriota bacterium]|nr:MAG: hypothetical protein IPN70_00525 [Candidatus Moranbacteria bacterium]